MAHAVTLRASWTRDAREAGETSLFPPVGIVIWPVGDKLETGPARGGPAVHWLWNIWGRFFLNGDATRRADNESALLFLLRHVCRTTDKATDSNRCLHECLCDSLITFIGAPERSGDRSPSLRHPCLFLDIGRISIFHFQIQQSSNGSSNTRRYRIIHA